MSTSFFVYTVYEAGGKKEHFSNAEMLVKIKDFYWIRFIRSFIFDSMTPITLRNSSSHPDSVSPTIHKAAVAQDLHMIR